MDKSLEKLAVEIEPGILDVSEDEEKRIKWEIIERYIYQYKQLLKEYERSIVPGAGSKTNKYGEPGFNRAYTYIQHPNFRGIAQERGKSYEYYRSVWSVACDRVTMVLNKNMPDGLLPWRLKLDHKAEKTDDFNGTLVLYKSPDWWWVRNGFIDKRP